jgi:biopolymer transport protein ExbD
MVTIRLLCPECRSQLGADERRAGARMMCPRCGALVVVPQPGRAEPSATKSEKPTAAVPVEEDPPIRFHSERESETEMDMTPMVDITFLLLIFFMVTAAFSLQQSIEVPPPESDEAGAETRTLEQIEADQDYVIIQVHGDNSIWVEGEEALSAQDVLTKLRTARRGDFGSDSKGPSRLLVMADGEARHETVVLALDAGNAVGMNEVQLATVDQDDF